MRGGQIYRISPTTLSGWSPSSEEESIWDFRWIVSHIFTAAPCPIIHRQISNDTGVTCHECCRDTQLKLELFCVVDRYWTADFNEPLVIASMDGPACPRANAPKNNFISECAIIVCGYEVNCCVPACMKVQKHVNILMCMYKV